MSNSNLSNKFGRMRTDGNVNVLCIEDGEQVTRLEGLNIYPVGSDVSGDYEHPQGIIITLSDANKIGLEIE